MKRWATWSVLLLPTVCFAGSDWVRRAGRIIAFDAPHALGYVASHAQSALFWGLLLYLASRVGERSMAVLFVVLFGLVGGVQDAFFAHYNLYLSVDAQIHARDWWWPVVGTLPLSSLRFVLAVTVYSVAGAGMIRVARRLLSHGRTGQALLPWAVLPAFLLMFGAPVSFRSIQSTLPDAIYFHGLGSLVLERHGLTKISPGLRVQRREPPELPAMVAAPARPRNLLLIVQESQRFDVSCVDTDPDCKLATARSSAVVPARIPLLKMRSHGSTTALSIAALWTGLLPTESSALLHRAPLLWEYAHAAGYDTAYWTSQNVMFGNMRLFVQEQGRARCAATNLDCHADLDTGARDALLSEHVITEWDSLREPFVAVVQYSNIHYPHVFDPSEAPFEPWAFDKAADKNTEFYNYYKNVVHLSDGAVARLLSHVRNTPVSPRTVVVYTADHGEGFRDHWQLGHTSSVYEEEVRVPTWIDAPPGTLSDSEREALVRARDQDVWLTDLGATLLDFVGVWDEPAVKPFRAHFVGRPLTRLERNPRPRPLSNCSALWECEFRNWGMQQGPWKIEAREWDSEFHCFHLPTDPTEQNNLGERACGALPELARQTFFVMPDVTPPGRESVAWGR